MQALCRAAWVSEIEFTVIPGHERDICFLYSSESGAGGSENPLILLRSPRLPTGEVAVRT